MTAQANHTESVSDRLLAKGTGNMEQNPRPNCISNRQSAVPGTACMMFSGQRFILGIPPRAEDSRALNSGSMDYESCSLPLTGAHSFLLVK